jgi:hypothetical protein
VIARASVMPFKARRHSRKSDLSESAAVHCSCTRNPPRRARCPHATRGRGLLPGAATSQ